MRIDQPYHEGELAIQERTGERAEAERNGRVIFGAIPKGALPFVARQPFAAMGSRDRDGRVWASALVGAPGFMAARDDRTVVIDLEGGGVAAADPLWERIEHDARVGLLLIELGTRKRLRVNGRLGPIADGSCTLAVDEAYPNCPKYIQRRHRTTAAPASKLVRRHRRGEALEVEQRERIARADTLFVASAHCERGVDVSHRGGNPGFVTVIDERRLRVPDYAGNSMFNTLGNLTVDPRAGVLFLDFERGTHLALTGRAEVFLDEEDPEGATGGTRRFWELEVEHWIETEATAPDRWELLDRSPFNP